MSSCFSKANVEAATEGIEQLVRVVALAGDGRAWVEPVGGGCGRCDEKEGCGKAHLTRMFASSRRFLVKNPTLARPGDEAIIILPAGTLFVQTILVYLLPLLALLLGALAGKFLAGETGGVVGGVFAFAAAFWRLPKILKRRLANPAFEPKIGRVIANSSPGGSPCD
jgi:sigma-E factor negative regulatory protein RseC